MEENINHLLSKTDKDRLVSIISAKIPNAVCPMCQHNSFVLADGYFNIPISNSMNDVVLGGTTIPSIGVICTNCGFISLHALGILGLLNDNNRKNDE